jgi:fructose-1,6-bisphosphatase
MMRTISGLSGNVNEFKNGRNRAQDAHTHKHYAIAANVTDAGWQIHNQIRQEQLAATSIRRHSNYNNATHSLQRHDYRLRQINLKTIPQFPTNGRPTASVNVPLETSRKTVSLVLTISDSLKFELYSAAASVYVAVNLKIHILRKKATFSINVTFQVVNTAKSHDDTRRSTGAAHDAIKKHYTDIPHNIRS